MQRRLTRTDFTVFVNLLSTVKATSIPPRPPNARGNLTADAAPLKADFLKLEMPADFLDRLNQLIAEFEKTTTEKAMAVGAYVAAKISLDETVARGLQALRQLDVVIRNKFNGTPGVLANRKRASHVAIRTNNKASAPPANPPDTPPALAS